MKCSFAYFFNLFFFCKQKSAYDMRISDWSSDVCSSDLMAEDFRRLARQILGTDGGDRAGAHVGDAAGIQDRLRHAGARIKQQQDGQFGRQVVLVVVDEVADHLDAGGINRLAQRAAQHVEMAVGDAGLELRSEEHTSELQSLMRSTYAV